MNYTRSFAQIPLFFVLANLPLLACGAAPSEQANFRDNYKQFLSEEYISSTLTKSQGVLQGKIRDFVLLSSKDRARVDIFNDETLNGIREVAARARNVSGGQLAFPNSRVLPAGCLFIKVAANASNLEREIARAKDCISRNCSIEEYRMARGSVYLELMALTDEVGACVPH